MPICVDTAGPLQSNKWMRKKILDALSVASSTCSKNKNHHQFTRWQEIFPPWKSICKILKEMSSILHYFVSGVLSTVFIQVLKQNKRSAIFLDHYSKVFNTTALTVFSWSHLFWCQKLLLPWAFIKQINKQKQNVKTTKFSVWQGEPYIDICLTKTSKNKNFYTFHINHWVNSIV